MQFRTIVAQFFDTLSAIPEAWHMIRDRKLWRGVDRYGWVAKVLLVAGVLLGWSFLRQVFQWFGQLGSVDSPISALSSMGNLASSVALEGYESFTSGFMKYVVLLLSEVLIYHFMQRALEEITDKPVSTRFQDFLDAQIRMLKVVFRTWIFELIATLGISIVFGIFGFLDWLEPAALFIVQCYFFGFVIMDNYFEQFDLSIRDSTEESRSLTGIALGLGIVLYLAMLVPIVGVVAGTIVVSVAAAIVMNQWSDIAFRPQETDSI